VGSETMPTIEIDKELYGILKKQIEFLKEKRKCSNPSFSNAIRDLIGMRHVGWGGKSDSCNPHAEQVRTTRVSIENEKELDG